jgi:hypothetical protein
VLVFRIFIFFIFDLLCKRFSLPSCIGSAVMALFIKRGENWYFRYVFGRHLPVSDKLAGTFKAK